MSAVLQLCDATQPRRTPEDIRVTYRIYSIPKLFSLASNTFSGSWPELSDPDSIRSRASFGRLFFMVTLRAMTLLEVVMWWNMLSIEAISVEGAILRNEPDNERERKE